MSTHVKIQFSITDSDGNTEIETMWAVKRDDGYELDNIPFYALGFACGDLVSATPDPDGFLRCTGLIAASGHSTIRLWFADASDVQKVRDELRTMGCASELGFGRLVAVDVPPNIPYDWVRNYLQEGERTDVFEYEEGCLGQSRP